MPRLRTFNKRKGKLSQSKKEYYENKRIQQSGLGDHTYFRKSPVEIRMESHMQDKNIEQIDSDIAETVIEMIQDDCPYNKGSNKVVEKAELHEFSFISQEEYASINSHNLAHEQVKPSTSITGHRIVDLQYVLNWSMKIQVEHSIQCTMGILEIIGEVLVGLGSVVTFQCNVCGYKIEKSTHKKGIKSVINYGAVWGTLCTGTTYQHLKDFLGAMDIPVMSYYLFHNIEVELADKWKDSLWESMQLAGQEERKLAMENGQVDSEGVPWTTVYCDGGWSHRSYGHSYNSSSGVAIIIGKLTKKLLFLGVRNKYCTVCSRVYNQEKLPPNHACYKNWNGSSGAMEASIIVEGFKQSETMHKLKFMQFIADGDSSVYSKIRSDVSYGPDVVKIECRNHAIKNFGKALHTIRSDSKLNVTARKLLTPKKIKELQDTCTKMIYINACQDVERLKADLQNSISHVFGHHSNCIKSYCSSVNDTSCDSLGCVKDTGLYLHLNSALHRLIAKGHRLIDNETSNRAELYMSILCKFNAGKRLNLSGRGSFQCRTMMSGLRFNEGLEWQKEEWKKLFGQSPGKNFKKVIADNTRVMETSAKRKLEFGSHSSHKKKIIHSVCNTDYGPEASQPQLTTSEYESEQRRVLKSLEIQPKKIYEIEQKTIGQWDNSYYLQMRRYRLTASHFGIICKRRLTTNCEKLVNTLLAPKHFDTKYTIYGKQKENVAQQKFIDSLPSKTVRNSGIFIHPQYNHLAASPDGIVDENGVLEIKCLLRVHESGKSLFEAAQTMKNLPVEIVNNKLQLKRNHDYFYQIQGQLNIANKDVCYFIIYINDSEPLYVEEIHKDEKYWNEMLVKLNNFYFQCYLPKVIDKNRKCLDENHK